jgi:prepilin-type N-terminal cleavage/methylation domain-containing protein
MPDLHDHRAATQRGFTLIELMVAMIVSSIVVLGIFAFSTIQQHTNSIHDRHVRVQRALEGAMWSVSQDLQLAGIGWARMCTEIRVWDAGTSRLINPGAVTDPTLAAVDMVSGEPYWVLRDGIQAFWNSTAATSLQGDDARSTSPSSAADAFDVIVAEANYVESIGVFSAGPGDLDPALGLITARTSPVLGTANLAEVQQMFPPGSFVLLIRANQGGLGVHPTRQGQCALLQVTSDVQSPADGEWTIPVGLASGFNANLTELALTGPPDDVVPPCDAGGVPVACDDWTGPEGGVPRAFDFVMPMGRLRWSRYEIDYAIPGLPYLVRYDIIGHQDTIDPDLPVGVVYPHCDTTCPAPQLHLFDGNAPPTAIAVGPMIEDMQVSAGCDGYTENGAITALFPMPPPDVGFEETVMYALPDAVIDEQMFGNRTQDEWVGNAANEVWAPDCVYWGTGEYRKDLWAALDPSGTAVHRFSPQTIRVTLTASSEMVEEAGSLATNTLIPIEDRPAMVSPVGVRQRFSLTEQFTPKNLRWRDPSAALPAGVIP